MSSMVKDKNHFAEIKQMLDQFKSAIKKLEDQGGDVSLLEILKDQDICRVE